MKNFKNETDKWQVWVNVFTAKQELVLSGTEQECEKFLNENNANQSSIYGSVFMIAPRTGRNEDFSTFACESSKLTKYINQVKLDLLVAENNIEDRKEILESTETYYMPYIRENGGNKEIEEKIKELK